MKTVKTQIEAAKDAILTMMILEEDGKIGELGFHAEIIKHLLSHYCKILKQIGMHNWIWYRDRAEYVQVEYTKCSYNEECESVKVGKYYQIKVNDDGTAYVIGTESNTPEIILCCVNGQDYYDGAETNVSFRGCFAGYCVGDDGDYPFDLGDKPDLKIE